MIVSHMILSVIFSLCNLFNNLCMYGIEEFLYLSVSAMFTLKCSGFLIFELDSCSLFGNIVYNFWCLVVWRAKFWHKVILLSCNVCKFRFWRPCSYSSNSLFCITFTADLCTLSRLLESSWVKELFQTTHACSRMLWIKRI